MDPLVPLIPRLPSLADTNSLASGSPDPLEEESFAGCEAVLAAERLARLQAEARVLHLEQQLEQAEAAQALLRTQHERIGQRLHMVASARCLLWYADVEATGGDTPLWHFRFPSEEAARRFVRVAVRDGETLVDAWYRSRLPEDREAADRCGNAAVRAGRDYSQEYRCRLDDGSVRWICEDVAVETVEEGRRWRAAGVCTDSTAQHEAQEELRESEARFRQLADSMPQVVWTSRPDGYLDYYNQRWYEYTGLCPGHGGDRSWASVLHPDDLQPCLDRWYHSVCTGEPYEVEYRWLRASDGAYRWHLGRALPVRDASGAILKWFGTATDIHDYKTAQAEIESLNARLRWAMSETHHRVKNNLQVISAMIELQSSSYEGSVPAHEIRSLRQHISGLAAIHDLLTEQSRAGESLDTLSARAALRKLLPTLEATLSGRQINAQVADVSIPSRQATALAIVTNELVANAIKHGRGDIGVSLHVTEGAARLEVSDEGRGFPEGFDVAQDAHTGLELVQMLARWDLAGHVEFGNRELSGGWVAVTFPCAPTP